MSNPSPPGHGSGRSQDEHERTRYLPEGAYLYDGAGTVRAEVVARVTARCVARWSDKYDVRIVNPPVQEKSGRLTPGDAAAQTIDAVFDWLDSMDASPYAVAFTLYRDGTPLLDQSEGFPGTLMLSRAQFLALQDCWEEQMLPRDLYFPADQQRVVVEPVRGFGGVYRTEKRYTPRQWEQRAQASATFASVPAEDERARAFLSAWTSFSNALMLRILQLSEPGGDAEAADERDRLAKLFGRIESTLRQARSLQPHLRRQAGAGLGPEEPSAGEAGKSDDR